MTSLGLPSPAVSSPDRKALLARRIQWFVAATITYNVIEAIIALTEGARVSSSALIGFGLDSVIEVSSAAAVAWQFAGRDPERRERVALRVIAFSFFALAAYVTVDSIRALFGFDDAAHSTVGIVLATVSLAVMPVLSAAQRRAGRELGSASAVADSRTTETRRRRHLCRRRPHRPWLHTRNHVAMLALAIRQRDRREALGQLIRIIVAAPGSLSGRYPDGNTGRAKVGLLQPMPTPPDLAELLHAPIGADVA